jgi:hypothetical protein
MRSLFIAAALLFLTVVGCKSTSTSDKNGSSMSAATDDCPMCPGIQHARADGTCPKCGMKVKG